MSAIEREQKFVTETIEEVFERLAENDRVNKRTIEGLQQRVSQVDGLLAENAKLRLQLQQARANDQQNLLRPSGENSSSGKSLPPSSDTSRPDNEQWEKKYNKVLRECEQLRSVNKDFHQRLGNAQTKLRNWNRLSSCGPSSPPAALPSVVPHPDQSRTTITETVRQRSSSPDLPPLRPGDAAKPIEKPHGLSGIAPDGSQGDLAFTSHIVDLAGPANRSFSGTPTQDMHNLKRKRGSSEGSATALPSHVDAGILGDRGHPVKVKSESSSSPLVAVTAHNIVPTSSMEDLSRSIQPPTPKRPKSRRGVSEQAPQQAEHNRTPLQRLDRNTKILPRTSTPKNTLSRKIRTSADAVHHLAEDGEELLVPGRMARSFDENTARSPNPIVDHIASHNRLGDLLSNPSPDRTALATTKANISDQSMMTPKAPPTSHHDTSTAKRKCLKPAMPPPRLQESTDVNPDDEPFRARPLHRLSLNNFKINPLRNDGLTYAYTDVVRNRTTRKCLPGCTRPECCGTAFRALSSALPSTDSEDLQTLLEYLGESSASQIAHLTPTEKVTLLTEAKTKKTADKYGKMHRHAWQIQRPKSPPGFWRTDMPGTQEEEEYRREGEERVRSMVEERWREAMKGTGDRGGNWIFKDE